jgi:casein kinase II subunit alpha
MDMWSFGTMLASMIFRKEPFFHGSSCIDQLLSAARVLGTESLYRFVEHYDIQMDLEDVETLGHHSRQPWTELITSDNQLLVTEEAIDLIDQLLQFDPKVSKLDSQISHNTNVHALASPYCA